jgi:hypothetical protein
MFGGENMDYNFLKVKMSRDFMDTIIKSNLLKRKFNLIKNPTLFVLITNRNEFSDYLYTKGYTIESVAKYYNIPLDFSITLKNDLTTQEIDYILQEELNNDIYIDKIKNGYILECEDIYKNIFINDKHLFNSFVNNYI